MVGNSEPDPFVALVSAALRQLLPPAPEPSDKRRLLVAFSGGVDSTALLLALEACRDDLDIELFACHVNHGLRGEESSKDAEFCAEICRSRSIPLQISNLEKLSSSAEAVLREARYGELEQAAKECGSTICLTAHTACDQVETMLFRLFRGTSPSGLVGIPEARVLSSGILVLRPLLQLNREDGELYLRRIGVVPRRDSSNADSSYSRNYIRHEVVTVVEERFPGFRERLLQFRCLLEADEEFMRLQRGKAEKELFCSSALLNDKLGQERLLAMPLALRRRIIAQSMKDHGVEPSFQRTEAVLEMLSSDQDSALSLSSRFDLRLSAGILTWWDKEEEDARQTAVSFEYELKSAGKTLIAPLNMMLGLHALGASVDPPDKYPESHSLEILADLSAVERPLTLRLRRPGDRIRPLGMKSMVRLKQFLHTHKSPKTLKYSEKTVLLADDKEVLWVPGCGISQKIAVRERPTHRIVFTCITPDMLPYV